MALAYVSLGSNINAEQHLCASLAVFKATFGQVTCSRLYQTPAEGFAGPPFLNAVIGFASEWDVETLQGWLRDLENTQGRIRHGEKFSSRTLDADLLLYGDVISADGKLPHADILKYPFVLYPLAEIAPTLQHPVLKQDIATIARHSRLASTGMQPIELEGWQT